MKRKTMILYSLAALALIYLLIVAYMALAQDSMVFHANRNNVFNQDYPPFSIVTAETADGLTLKGLYAAPQGDKPVIVYFHGNAGSDVDRIYKTKLPLENGYGFLLTEYRGYGGNPGKPSEDGLYTDARAWLNFLRTQNIPVSRWVYHGESLGTGVAVQMTTEQKPLALILEAPFTSVTAVASFYYPFLPVKTLLKYRFDSLSKVAALTMPVLIYHGTKDVTVPYRFGKQLFNAIPSEQKYLETVKGAHHADLYTFNADQTITDFLKKHAT